MKNIVLSLFSAFVLTSCSKDYAEYSFEKQKTSAYVPVKTCGVILRKDPRADAQGIITYFLYINLNPGLHRQIVTKEQFDAVNVGDQYCF